jgi:hypothetical protein
MMIKHVITKINNIFINFMNKTNGQNVISKSQQMLIFWNGGIPSVPLYKHL